MLDTNVSIIPSMLQFVLNTVSTEVNRRNLEIFRTMADNGLKAIFIRTPDASTFMMFAFVELQATERVECYQRKTTKEKPKKFVFSFDTPTEELLNWVFSAFGAYHS